MRKTTGGATSIAALLVVLIALGGLAWWFRADLLRVLGGEREPTEVSAEAASSAAAKLERLTQDGETVRLSSIELTSLMRYRAPAEALLFLREPEVAMHGDTVELSGVVPTDRLPSLAELDRIRPLLPDSARVEVLGQLGFLQSGSAALQIRQVEFAGIPVPSRYYPAILERMGRREVPGLDPAAIALRLPAGVGSARVEGGYLVLTPTPN